ncbi:unnamed protein product, partial [Ixodes pacificus]
AAVLVPSCNADTPVCTHFCRLLSVSPGAHIACDIFSEVFPSAVVICSGRTYGMALPPVQKCFISVWDNGRFYLLSTVRKKMFHFLVRKDWMSRFPSLHSRLQLA